ncbi:MAG: TVP38/TMEM64 family protein [Clostridiales bacterium]|nr:TVP38/TMEM64 family protein [Clostridiales bacterium]
MKKETKGKIVRGVVALAILAVVVLAIILPLHFTGALATIKNTQDLQLFIQSGGVWSYLIFFAIQFLQVTFLPIPAAVTTVAGMLALRNIWLVALVSFVAVMLGSIFAFFLGRKVGKRIVIWIAGEDDFNQWADKLGKGKYVFFIMMLLPVFPDDILCMVAGTTNISWKFFVLTNFVTRPIGILCTCFLGSGIIPFAGLWLILWGVLAVGCIILFILCYKYQPQIEKFIYKVCHKFERKKKED